MVKHHDPVGGHTDRTLGMCVVDTATALQAPGVSTQEWFPVRKGPGMRAGDAPQGQVHVKVRAQSVHLVLCRLIPLLQFFRSGANGNGRCAYRSEPCLPQHGPEKGRAESIMCRCAECLVPETRLTLSASRGTGQAGGTMAKIEC